MTRIENEWRYFDDASGIAYPWYTKPCLEFLETIDLNKKIIFEYGSGYSTLWFRSKGAEVHGVDSNEQWANLSATRFESVILRK